MLAERMGRVSASPTLKVLVEADKLRQQGVDVVELARASRISRPPTTSSVRRTRRLTPTSPVHPRGGHLRAEAGDWRALQKDYGVDYKPSEVIVTAGGKQALYNVAVALFGRGDEVITHAPCWPTLLEQVKLADGSPVVVQTYADDGFAIRAEAILNASRRRRARSSSTRRAIRPAR